MKTIYLVSEGYYSDYHILAVYSTRPKADRFKEAYDARCRNSDETEIEEFSLDTPQKEWHHCLVRMLRDGKVDALFHDIDGSPAGGLVSFSNERNSEDFFLYEVSTSNEVRAVKVANEKRAQIIAAGAWGDLDKAKAAVGQT